VQVKERSLEKFVHDPTRASEHFEVNLSDIWSHREIAGQSKCAPLLVWKQQALPAQTRNWLRLALEKLVQTNVTDEGKSHQLVWIPVGKEPCTKRITGRVRDDDLLRVGA
jgi:hypothetical protein